MRWVLLGTVVLFLSGCVDVAPAEEALDSASESPVVEPARGPEGRVLLDRTAAVGTDSADGSFDVLDRYRYIAFGVESHAPVRTADDYVLTVTPPQGEARALAPDARLDAGLAGGAEVQCTWHRVEAGVPGTWTYALDKSPLVEIRLRVVGQQGGGMDGSGHGPCNP